jgi:hypothetical protein
MISCHPDVGGTALDHGQNGSEDTTYCADLLAAHILRSGHAEKMPEQFIGPVNQVHVHAAAVRSARNLMLSTKRFGGFFSRGDSEIIRTISRFLFADDSPTTLS